MVNWKEHVRETRTKLGMTQSEFAQILGVSLPLVQRWEGGLSEPGRLQSEIIAKINQQLKSTSDDGNDSLASFIKNALFVGGAACGLYHLLKFIFQEKEDKQ
jgi:transcriptional regulator with XRE-family HTH domain